MILDGNFPTVDKLNPEYPEVFTLGKKIANEIGSDLLIATDPDADRLAVTVRTEKGDFVTLSGNQVGLLLIDYIISAYEENGTMPPSPFVVKSLVSSKLADIICKAHGVTMYNVLTGFKYIGEMINIHDGKDGSYIFGFEESCGYLKGTYARDKDGIVAAMLVCEMAAKYSLEGKTLHTALNELYEKYGYSFEKTTEITTEGIDAKEKQAALMTAFRTDPPKAFGSVKTLKLGDLKARKYTILENNDIELSPFPAADVLLFELETGDTIVVRPSGTEPKVKFYYLITAPDKATAEARFAEYKATLDNFVATI
jgi:phosphoglucomutase